MGSSCSCLGSRPREFSSLTPLSRPLSWPPYGTTFRTAWGPVLGTDGDRFRDRSWDRLGTTFETPWGPVFGTLGDRSRDRSIGPLLGPLIAPLIAPLVAPLVAPLLGPPTDRLLTPLL
jgi:hypothetical protein